MDSGQLTVKKHFVILLAFCAFALVAKAEDKACRDTLKHEVRVGWGDQMWETMNFHETRGRGSLTPDGMYWKRQEHYRYTQHWFAEYQYRVNKWFGVGGMFDGSGVLWDDVYRDNSGEEVTRSRDHNFYNLTIMPTVRFSYLWTKYVSMHSGLGIGLNINGGSEPDPYGKYTLCSMAVDVTLVGVAVGYEHWFGTVDFGGLFAMNGQNQVFMFGSKIIRASIGYRF